MLILMLVLWIADSVFSAGQEPSFCSTLLINSSDPRLRVSRENNVLDFAHRHEYKQLHCCFANYHTIEWYKDETRLLVGNTYHITTFQYAEDGNQTLVSHRLSSRDTGLYTCIARQGSEHLKNTIKLTVDVHDEFEDPPVLIVKLKDQYAWVGESRRFCCEAFVGFGKLTPSFSQVLWMYANADAFVARDVANTTYYSRNRHQIKGALLSFEPVTKKAFGTYTCKIDNGIGDPLLYNVTLHEGDDPDTKIRTTYKGTIIILVVFTSLFVVIITAVTRWHLELQLLWKDRMGKLEEDDDRLYDVFVCYDQEDAEYVLNTLVPVLEQHCQYNCFAWERDILAGEWIPETYSQRVRQSRRFLMVLSQALANNTWCIYALYVAIDAMLSRKSRIICILLQDIDWDAVTVEDGRPGNCTLHQVTRVVRIIRWDPRPTSKKKFWKKLRLYLPPRRSLPLNFEEPKESHSSSQEALVDVVS
ncbi:interleukin-1 receptor accessory protein-like 1 [Anabrus simplex]|uniref:interleukin-1 receptor accessory protein-like 1 n=1 Tax=Anabrus simplex TaxID=316456 RepID=UPI0035A30FF7